MRDHINDGVVAPEDELDQVFGLANPNPARVGCPPRAVLAELARKQRPIHDLSYLHLARCSECYVEVRALQASLASATAAWDTPINRLMAAAAVILMIAGGAWFMAPPPRQAAPRTTAVAPASVAVDLRSYGIERGDPNSAGPKPMLLPRDRLNLTILLPIASEPGAYDFELMDGERRLRLSTKGTAALVDFVTTLRINVDLSALQPGRYEIGLRHQGEDWRFFTATLQ